MERLQLQYRAGDAGLFVSNMGQHERGKVIGNLPPGLYAPVTTSGHRLAPLLSGQPGQDDGRGALMQVLTSAGAANHQDRHHRRPRLEDSAGELLLDARELERRPIPTLPTGALHGQAGVAEPMPWALFGLPLLVGGGGAVASVGSRLRMAGAVERHQVKWVASALIVVAVVVVAGFLGPLERFLGSPIGSVVVFGTYVLIPAAIVVAILRYRLFDIDRFVSRTVTHSVVVGLLSAGYFGSVIVSRGLLPGRGQVPVALSTLIVAASFLPLRRRVQRVVDRRFFRSRYDAGQVVERLIGELKTTLDPESVATRTRVVVTEVFSPGRFGIWVAAERSVGVDRNVRSPVAGTALPDR